MRSFLKDAERRMERSESVETWVRQVREVAYEADDTIDEFMHHKDKEKHKSGFKCITKEIVHFPKNFTARHQIATKLPKIKVKVREVCQSPNSAATCGQSPNSTATCVSGVTLMQPTLMQPQLHHNAVDNATCASGITLMQLTPMQPKMHHHAVDNAAAIEQPRLHQTKQEF